MLDHGSPIEVIGIAPCRWVLSILMSDGPPFPRLRFCQIGPRLQGSAAPLRALDCSGPIQEGDAVYEGKGGSQGRGGSQTKDRRRPHPPAVLVSEAWENNSMIWEEA